MSQRRFFIPQGAFIPGTVMHREVQHWTWTKGKGLQVTYRDGLTCKSDYTLHELLKLENVTELGVDEVVHGKARKVKP